MVLGELTSPCSHFDYGGIADPADGHGLVSAHEDVESVVPEGLFQAFPGIPMFVAALLRLLHALKGIPDFVLDGIC